MNADIVDTCRVDIMLGSELLMLLDALYKKGDVESLKLVRALLTSLIMSHVQDKLTSFIDLGEYCDALVLALDGSETAQHEATALRTMILDDLTAPPEPAKAA